MLAEALAELEERIRDAGEELATIKRYVERLEEDNKSMQELIRAKNMAGSGKANLVALFNAGFHVCSARFGEMRDGDCLFCASLMDKDALKKDDES